MVSRRWLLGALMAGSAEMALGAPLASVRPQTRTPRTVPIRSPEALIAEAALGGEVAFAVAVDGQVVEGRGAGLPLPPASTAKALTALYALRALGPGHRFTTRLLATGPVRDGQLEGDLILAGGGDPDLDTDDLAEMASALKAAGVRAVSGRFLVWGGALPTVPTIDPEQPDHVGYSPAVSGLNLNYNRVHFSWDRVGERYDMVLDARAARLKPRVETARMTVSERRLPVYAYAAGAREEWSVARTALGAEGSRWLPVRRPALYAGDVFRTLARSHGIVLPVAAEIGELPPGEPLVERPGAPVEGVIRAMLRYSTNLTAEALGLAATRARGTAPATLAESGEAMSAWLSQRFGARSAALVDHSGLGGGSRISAADMLRVLGRGAVRSEMAPLMKAIPQGTLDVRAKTGTLNFVSALAGYVAEGGLAFAILTADVARREALSEAERERPPGGRAWTRRSRALQSALIGRWAAVYL